MDTPSTDKSSARTVFMFITGSGTVIAGAGSVITSGAGAVTAARARDVRTTGAGAVTATGKLPAENDAPNKHVSYSAADTFYGSSESGQDPPPACVFIRFLVEFVHRLVDKWAKRIASCTCRTTKSASA